MKLQNKLQLFLRKKKNTKPKPPENALSSLPNKCQITNLK